MELLERSSEQALLEDALVSATAGAGRVVLVSGEAGIGKTSLVRAFAESARSSARVLVGACDDLGTPRPLGPFHDMALGIEGPLRRALREGGDRDAVLSAALEELGYPLQPTVVVVEDAHWSDEATRDVLRFLGRRIEGLPAVLVITYRSDVPADHPWRRTLGALTGPHLRRVELARLSRRAVDRLAQDRSAEPGRIWQLTRGNPFLVDQLLAVPEGRLPLGVRDAVAARLADLSRHGRRAVRELAAAPGGLELAVLEHVLGAEAGGIAEAEGAALVELDGVRVQFRHELLRHAVLALCTQAELRRSHRQLLDALQARGADPARLVHHAVGADDGEAVLRHAPTAARAASRSGGHRDALTLYSQALDHAERLSPVDHARLLRHLAFELYLANRHAEAADRAAEAVALVDGTDDLELGRALALLAHVACWAARPEVAREAARRSVEVLADDPGRALVMAHTNVAFVAAMQGRHDAARRAAETAKTLVDDRGLVRERPFVLAQLGGAMMMSDDPAGEAVLHQGIDTARALGAHEYVPLLSTWLASGLIRAGRPNDVGAVVEQGIAYGEEHEIDVGVTTLRMLRSELQLRQGRWSDAEAGLVEIAADPEATGWGQSVAWTLLGRVRARQGAAGARELLSRGWELALRSEEPERIIRAGVAWLEWAHLHADPAAAAMADRALGVAADQGDRWALGELLRLRAELDGTGPAVIEHRGVEAAAPWAAGIRGDWEAAAAAWSELGWPFEQARELAASGRDEQRLEALRILDTLGATATATALRRRLRADGVSGIPRGPLAGTREHPAQLTGRQAEVLALLSEGLTNADIADRLVLSIRTVDHHVSAVLGKLGASSRHEAAERAHELGLV